MTRTYVTQHNLCVESKKPEAVRAGERIKRARQLADHMTRGRLAELAKIGLSALGNYEQGLRTIDIPEAERIEKVTGIPAAFLLGVIDEEEMRLLRTHRTMRRDSPAPLADSRRTATEDPFATVHAPVPRRRTARR